MNFRLPFPYVTASAPDFLVALMFLVTWVEPSALGENMANTLGVVIFMEFFIIHSAAFMSAVFFMKKSRIKKVFSMLGLGVFYSIFVLAFTAGYGVFWPFWSFWLLTLNRLLSMLSVPKGEESSSNLTMNAMWAVSGFVYIVGIFIFLALPVPNFGITEEVRKTFIVDKFWITNPESILAFGFFYFFLVGVAEFFFLKKTATKKFTFNSP